MKNTRPMRASDVFSFGDIVRDDACNEYVLDRIDGARATLLPIVNGRASAASTAPVFVKLPDPSGAAIDADGQMQAFPIYRTGRNFYC
jgi:hypothetical protein